MSKREPTFAAIAAAIEMTAIVGAIWAWNSQMRTNAIIMTVIALALLAGSFFLRWRGFTLDRMYDRQWLNGRAVVDDSVINGLREAKMPVAIVRAVNSVGSQPTLRRFRLYLKKACGPELTSEQLETILHYTRASR